MKLLDALRPSPETVTPGQGKDDFPFLPQELTPDDILLKDQILRRGIRETWTEAEHDAPFAKNYSRYGKQMINTLYRDNGGLEIQAEAKKLVDEHQDVIEQQARREMEADLPQRDS
jgi:hypothetical protein